MYLSPTSYLKILVFELFLFILIARDNVFQTDVQSVKCFKLNMWKTKGLYSGN